MRYRLLLFIINIISVPLLLPLDAQISLGVNAGITRMKFSGDPPSAQSFALVARYYFYAKGVLPSWHKN